LLLAANLRTIAENRNKKKKFKEGFKK